MAINPLLVKYRRLTHNDVVSACEWSKQHCGDDNPADVMAHKLLTHLAGNHGELSGYHERDQKKCEELMSDIESRFKVEREDNWE